MCCCGEIIKVIHSVRELEQDGQIWQNYHIAIAFGRWQCQVRASCKALSSSISKRSSYAIQFQLSHEVLTTSSLMWHWPRPKPAPVPTVTQSAQLFCFSTATWPTQLVEYELCMLVRRCLYRDAPSYLVDLIKPSVATSMRAWLRSTDSKTCGSPYNVISWRSFFAVAVPRT